MSVGWIRTEAQRERHKAACRARYRAKKENDPDHNRKVWEKKKARMIANGTFDRYTERQKRLAKIIYERKIASGLLTGEKDRERRRQLVLALGAKCVRCGYEEDIRALVLDHKNGDGFLDRKRVGSHISRYYISRIEEAKSVLQVLCFNCNAIKAIDEKEHNRTRRRN